LSKHDEANFFGSPIHQIYYGTCTKTFALFDSNCQQQDGNNSKAVKVSGVGRREVIAASIVTTLIVATSSAAVNEKQNCSHHKAFACFMCRDI
jgi:hypothetical protein